MLLICFFASGCYYTESFNPGKGLVIKYRGVRRQNLFKWRQFFVDPSLKKGMKNPMAHPITSCRIMNDPPLVIVVRSIRAIGMLRNGMTVGLKSHSLGRFSPPVSWINEVLEECPTSTWPTL